MDWKIDETVNRLQKYIDDPKNSSEGGMVEDFLDSWNMARDNRPIFVGFWGEIKDLFIDLKGNSLNISDWADQIRDRFGLGHHDPLENGGKIPVMLLKYRLKEVIEAKSDNAAAIPTVLDGDLSPYFCPTPQKGYSRGQTLDLSPGDYELTCEVIHSFIKFRPEHIFRVGYIEKTPGKTLEKARKIHLGLFKSDYENYDNLYKRSAMSG